MKRAFSLAALCCALALAAAAAGIDGKWVTKMEMKGGKKKGGTAVTVEFALELKSDGDKLTGTVSGGPGRRAASMTVESGKIEGNKFSFTTVQKGRKADQKFQWEGAVSGDELKGTRTPEGRRRGAEFTAKRTS
ncbi:MAG: hypothetical protein AAB225_15130 [Acidobacteriota bacterium]